MVRVRNTQEEEQTLILTGHRGPVRCLAFATDSNLATTLASGGDDSTIRLWRGAKEE
jgi:WD40 repeat protein